jgi:hypothetical protein
MLLSGAGVSSPQEQQVSPHFGLLLPKLQWRHLVHAVATKKKDKARLALGFGRVYFWGFGTFFKIASNSFTLTVLCTRFCNRMEFCTYKYKGLGLRLGQGQGKGRIREMFWVWVRKKVRVCLRLRVKRRFRVRGWVWVRVQITVTSRDRVRVSGTSDLTILCCKHCAPRCDFFRSCCKCTIASDTATSFSRTHAFRIFSTSFAVNSRLFLLRLG